MESKKYPNTNLTIVSLSTIVKCGKCGRENYIHEEMLTDDAGNYCHQACASDRGIKKTEEAKVVTVSVTDDLNVKSEGR